MAIHRAFVALLITTLLEINVYCRSHFNNTVVNVGFILPDNDSYAVSIRKIRPVIDVALETIVKKQYLNVHKINVTYANSGADVAIAPNAAYNIFTEIPNLEAFFGPMNEAALERVAMHAKLWELPILTPGGYSDAFENKHYYSTLIRFGNVLTKHIVSVLSQFMEHNEWTRAKLLYAEKDINAMGMPSMCYQLPPAIKVWEASGHEQGKGMHISHAPIRGRLSHLLVKEVGKDFAIVILCASPDVVRRIMARAQRLQFNNGHYVFMVLDLFRTQTEIRRPWYRDADTASGNMAAMESYKFVMIFSVLRPKGDEHHQISLLVKQKAEHKYNDRSFSNDLDSQLSVFYDAVLLFTLALNRTVARGITHRGHTELIKQIFAHKYNGITGKIMFDKDGNRLTDYSILDMGPENGTFYVIADYHSNVDIIEDVKEIDWGSEHERIPSDRPTCSYDEDCDDRAANLGTIVTIASIVFVCCLVLMYVVYFRFRKRTATAMASSTWQILWKDVILEQTTKTLSRKSSISSPIIGDSDQLTPTVLSTRPSETTRFTSVGYLDGTRVSIKFLKRNSFVLDNAALRELGRMMGIQHDQICKFMGACIDEPNQSIMSEYCQKGSLRDVLENESINLDWVFRFSLIQDIAKGMVFIHGGDFRSHGDLRSSNCLVDARFVLKITDFGLHFLRDGRSRDGDPTELQFKKRLWTAPELLRMDHPPVIGTQKGDVYSFAIICQEVVYRKGVFHIETHKFLTAKDKYENVIRGDPPYLRPLLQSEHCSHPLFYELTRKCWSEEPEERPLFHDILQTLRKVNKRSGNITDNILRRMETYANDLETIVAARTELLMEEKKRADEILHLLLPRSVAKQLIHGETVAPEWYDSVTIFFSDIVGFTALAASCTPMDIIDLLSDLYTVFDSIIDNYDVYKVETIGDAYMVVSGLPLRNGIQHAAEISWMAIAIMTAVRRFRIPFRQEAELRLRIGVHTGPVCTGVVGHKMPRYCLFGNTVTTAASYESGGLPQKIHLSGDTKELLDKIGFFETASRGEVDMKTRGKVTTYWLLGSTTPLTRSIPSIPRNTENATFDRSRRESRDQTSSHTSCHTSRRTSLALTQSFLKRAQRRGGSMMVDTQPALTSRDLEVMKHLQTANETLETTTDHAIRLAHEAEQAHEAEKVPEKIPSAPSASILATKLEKHVATGKAISSESVPRIEAGKKTGKSQIRVNFKPSKLSTNVQEKGPKKKVEHKISKVFPEKHTGKEKLDESGTAEESEGESSAAHTGKVVRKRGKPKPPVRPKGAMPPVPSHYIKRPPRPPQKTKVQHKTKSVSRAEKQKQQDGVPRAGEGLLAPVYESSDISFRIASPFT